MASCPKCGRAGFKRRKGFINCRKCGRSGSEPTPYIQESMRIPPVNTRGLFIVPQLDLNKGEYQ